MTNESKKSNDLSNPSDEISFQELVLNLIKWYRFLLSKWVLLVCIGLLGSALGFLYAYSKKPTYTATTTFVLDDGDKSSPLGSLSGLASVAGIDLGGGGGGLFQGDNIIELYKSRTMIQKALLSKAKFDNKEELLIDRFISFNKLKDSFSKVNWATTSFSDTSKFTVVQDSVLREVVRMIDKQHLFVSKPDKKLSLIQVDVKSGDELFAKAFAEEIVRSVNEFYIQTKTKRSTQNVNILQHKTDSVRQVMNGAIYSAARVADATPNLNPTRQTQRNAPVQKAQFSAETNKAVLSEFLKTLELSKANLLKETPLIQVIDYPILPLEKERLGKSKAMIVGGLLFGILAVLFIVIKKILKGIIASEKL
jgi:uncharacterized protein involved in exopolysaccharide biosynthesis